MAGPPPSLAVRPLLLGERDGCAPARDGNNGSLGSESRSADRSLLRLDRRRRDRVVEPPAAGGCEHSGGLGRESATAVAVTGERARCVPDRVANRGAERTAGDKSRSAGDLQTCGQSTYDRPVCKQRVRGSSPLSSTAGQRPVPISGNRPSSCPN